MDKWNTPPRAWDVKTTWRQLTERYCREWKLCPHIRDTWRSGLGCSKLSMPLVNVSLQFQMLIFEILYSNILRGAVVEWLEQLGYSAESRRIA